MDIVTVVTSLLALCSWDFVQTQSTEGDGMIREYCQGEDFVASCNQGEVITMTTAMYGSMKIGRCLDEDYGHLGCAADVIDLADRECSGKRECIIRVTNNEMDAARKCPRDLGRYLEVSYRCKQVITPSYQRCTRPSTLSATAKPQYLASLVSRETGCGLTKSPWILQAKQGQNINISLTSYTYDKVSNQSQDCAIKYGYLFDLDTESVMNLCEGGRKQQQVYLSEGSELQVLLDKTSLDTYSFLIKFQAIGCRDIRPVPNTWSKCNGDTLTLGCKDNKESWTLKCRGNHWIGLAKNCSEARVTTETSPKVMEVQLQENANYGQNLLIVTIVGCVTLFSCVVIVVTGIICIKRLNKYKYTTTTASAGSLKYPANRNSVLTTYLPVFNPSQQNTLATGNRNQTDPCLLSHQSSGGEPCVCETQTYKSISDRDSVQYYVLDQDYMANSQMT